MVETAIILYVVAIVLGLVLTIAWIILPFAIIGTKPILRELLREVQRTNASFELLRASISNEGTRNLQPDGRVEPR